MKLKRIRTWIATAAAALLGLTALQAQGTGGFRFRGLLNRFVVPNNAGRNSSAVFCLDNPSSSGVDIKIFSLNGTQVARLDTGAGLPLVANSACPLDSPIAGGPRYAAWDGKSNGAIVHSGVYFYQVQAEGLTFTGALVVVR